MAELLVIGFSLPKNHFFTLSIKTEPVNISRESYYIKYVMKQSSVVGE